MQFFPHLLFHLFTFIIKSDKKLFKRLHFHFAWLKKGIIQQIFCQVYIRLGVGRVSQENGFVVQLLISIQIAS